MKNEIFNEENELINESGTIEPGEQEPDYTPVEDENFTPIQIGLSDSKAETLAFNATAKVLEICDAAKAEFERFFNEKFSIDDFLSFLKSDPKQWICEKHIKKNGLVFPKFSTLKIIELNLLEIPDFKMLVELHGKFLEAWKELKSANFVIYSLREFFDEANHEFYFPPGFHEKCDLNFARFTESQTQNDIVETFNEIAKNLNRLAQYNIIRTQYGITELNHLQQWFELEKYPTFQKFVVSNVLFYKQRTSNYRIKKQFAKPFTNYDLDCFLA